MFVDKKINYKETVDKISEFWQIVHHGVFFLIEMDVISGSDIGPLALAGFLFLGGVVADISTTYVRG